MKSLLCCLLIVVCYFCLSVQGSYPPKLQLCNKDQFCPIPKAGGNAPGYRLTNYVESFGARCLDGTPGIYYLQPGSGNGTHKWYIHHMGGGWCVNIDDCYARSQTNLGSSKFWGDSVDIDGMGGYFSPDPKINPTMYNWNKVFMAYCDGGSFAGFNNSATPIKNTNLYFRGKGILDAVIHDLMFKRNLKLGTDVVVSGCSAGGLATYLHLDHWVSELDQGSKVVGLPDSGFFMDYQGTPDFEGYMRWGYSYFNVTSGLNADCVEAYKNKPAEAWKCYFAQYTSPYIRNPIFALQSRFDAWQIPNILGSDSAPVVNQFGRNLTVNIINNLLVNQRAGVWLDSCYHHCGGWPGITIDGYQMADAFAEFYRTLGTSKKLWFQDETYPCNACCK